MHAHLHSTTYVYQTRAYAVIKATPIYSGIEHTITCRFFIIIIIYLISLFHDVINSKIV